MPLSLILRLQGELSPHQVKALKEYKPVDFVVFFFNYVSMLEQNNLGSQELEENENLDKYCIAFFVTAWLLCCHSCHHPLGSR